jgi:hypothetical protein|tara:strand:+ start:1243 stop:2310 length:1068 start_codon:yes stop_codon:yes gene_type:complete
MSYLLANGCSFTTMQCNNSNFYHTDEEKRKLGVPEGNWPMWPSYVSDKLNLLTLNLGKAGQSNAAIAKQTIAQAYRKKPKIIMHLWTGGDRRNLLGRNLNDINYYNVIAMADLLIKNYKNFTDRCKTTPPVYVRNSLELIKKHYPDSYEDSIKNYNQFCKEDNSLIKWDDAKKRHNSWQDEYSIDWFMKCWTSWAAINNTESIAIADMLIEDELLPFIHTYNFCKQNKIKFISSFCYSLASSSGVSHDRLKQNHRTNFRNMNKFETALYGYSRIKKIMKDRWMKNPVFKEMEEKILLNEFIMHSWPALSYVTNKPRMQDWLKGWKPISDLDGHPNWDTQKIIGDFFYDLYKKNYT